MSHEFLTAHNTTRYASASAPNFGDIIRIRLMHKMVQGRSEIVDVGCWDGLVSRDLLQ
jgi:hypothetical protein